MPASERNTSGNAKHREARAASPSENQKTLDTAKKGREPATRIQIHITSDDESIPADRSSNHLPKAARSTDKTEHPDNEDVEYDQEPFDSEFEADIAEKQRGDTGSEPTLADDVLAKIHISRGYSIIKLAKENRLIATPSKALVRARADFKDDPHMMSKLAIMIARFHRSTIFDKDSK
jgi:hypothetical protein